MPEILDWQRADKPHAVTRRAARILAQGGVVGLPTETVYGLAASALQPEAVDRLVQGKGRDASKPLALAIGGAQEAIDWLPELGAVARRLTRRCWPGPVTVVSGDGIERGLAGRLAESVRHRVCPAGTLGLRVPAHPAILDVLRRLAGPLVLTSANRSGEPEATTADAMLEAVGDQLDLAIADGPCRYGTASTVVQATGNSWKILREGVVPAETLARLAGCVIVFVCTGNTCRSPLAEVLCKKLLAESLGCTPEELPARGFTICSAGMAAMSGGPAAFEAIEVARELGADLSGHMSLPLTAELVRQADVLIAMTRGHLFALAERFGSQGVQLRLLSPDGQDVPDPIGADQETYRACARQIQEYLAQLLPEVQQP
jgi:protein-tyrosine phosphatase